MALDSELYNLKSAGTYRFEYDKSVIKQGSEPLNNVRMLVGFSKKGPFNTPVFVKDTKKFTELFGGIDRTLEKRGSFFHRSCLAALSAGPIYCLNLLKLYDDDDVNAIKFAASATCKAQTSDPQTANYDYRGMYNIDTFYTPSDESFLYNVGRSASYVSDRDSTNDILDFTNIGKNPVSVVVTKASDYNTMNYQVTCQEWFGKGNVPEYLSETSYISDFMVDVYVLGGNWGGEFGTGSEPYARFASDVKFAKYYSKEGGLIRRRNEADTTDTMFNQFLNEPDVNLVAKYTGCLIPGFVDKNGNNLYIEYLVNSDTETTGLMCAVNEEVFNGEVLIDGDRQGIDMVGHSIYKQLEAGEDVGNLRFLSYNGTILGDAIASSETEDVVDNGFAFDTDHYKTTTTGFVSEFADEVEDEPTSGTVVGGIVKRNDFNLNAKSIKLYVYYYKEVDEEYVEPSGMMLDYEAVYNECENGKKAYIAYYGGETSGDNPVLVPVVNAVKSELYTAIDAKLPQNYTGCEHDGEEYGSTLQSELLTAYGEAGARIAANPIVKYEFTLAYDKDVEFSSNDNDNYMLTSNLNKVGYVDVNNGSDKNTLVFMEGTDVYAKRASLGTNDQIVLGPSGSAWNAAIHYDLNWIGETAPFNEVEGFEIINSNYPVRYTACVMRTTDGEIENDAIGASNFCFDSKHSIGTQPSTKSIDVVLRGGGLEKTVAVVNTSTMTGIEDITPNQFVIELAASDEYKNIVVGNYILAKSKRLTRIASITKKTIGNGIYRVVTCQDEVLIDKSMNVWTVEVFTKLADWFKYYNVFTLNGFELKEKHQPNGTNERQREILNLLTEEDEATNLYSALTDRELIQFRYLVDTFGYGIEPECKSQYTRLCQGRKSAFAIVNMPSCNDFKNSEDPRFVDKNKAVSAEFIAKGGDPDSNPSFLFSLPTVVNGATWGAYYYPYLKVYSNYSTVLVPPAAYVSNNYVERYKSGAPWTTVSGERRGVITGNNVVGVESTLVRDSRDWLEPAGINSIIYRNGIGCEIYANKTAKQTPKSALSSINCREVCIYIQDGVERILENYLFENNTPQTRMEIKTLVDNFLDTVKHNGGVYDFQTVMDESNNTNELIDRNMGVIDLFIEPVRAMEIIAQRLTILRTGAIVSGNFE